MFLVCSSRDTQNLKGNLSCCLETGLVGGGKVIQIHRVSDYISPVEAVKQVGVWEAELYQGGVEIFNLEIVECDI
jgi:hypothetical protein